MLPVRQLLTLIPGNLLAMCAGLLAFHFIQSWPIALMCSAFVLVISSILSYKLIQHSETRFLKTLNAALLHLKDGEYSIQIPEQTTPRFNKTTQLFNQVITTLREEHVHLLQRDLMLNRVFDTVSSALVLTDAHHKIVLCNPAARQLLNQGKPIRGLEFPAQFSALPATLLEAIDQQQNLMFTVENSTTEQESWYLFCEHFQLHGYTHCLYHFQPLTQALARAEVDTWKKVIRVFSHELNNSLAPVSSMAHSGLQIVQNSSLASKQHDLLVKIFTTLQERSTHLRNFLNDYAQLSRLPVPLREPVTWQTFFANLQGLANFDVTVQSGYRSGFFDAAQLSQVLINLLKNAQEAGASNNGISIEIKEQGAWDLITVRDDGTGMSDEQIKQATLPFYSTKRDGSGMGLALCREIIEAHNGRITFANNPDKGLKISIWLPAFTQETIY